MFEIISWFGSVQSTGNLTALKRVRTGSLTEYVLYPERGTKNVAAC
uniref:Uncharacterized protein n=1 Tax=Anguilla anguilla TaxID=7936 RepID=A0A0E9VQK7_ANGAN